MKNDRICYQKCIKPGEGWPVHSDCSLCPLVFGDKGPFSLWVKESISHRRVLWLVSGGRSESPSCTCSSCKVLHIPSVLNIHYAEVSCLEVARPCQHIQVGIVATYKVKDCSIPSSMAQMHSQLILDLSLFLERILTWIMGLMSIYS